MKTVFTGLWLGFVILCLASCEATSVPLIPTERPTITPTFTPTITATPNSNQTATPSPTQRATQDPSLPTPTPLLGASRTPSTVFVTPTRSLNPNAPRIEFFTSDPLRIEPGKPVTLFWSARNTNQAVIYRLDSEGRRAEVFNVSADGNLPINTRISERGELRFVLAVGTNETYTEATHIIPLQCPLTWFFSPAPEDCPTRAPQETTLFDQTFERGRMIYAQELNVVYVLFNDGQSPAWLSFENRYNPEIHAERDPNAPPDFIQPLRELGYLWRTNDVVRTRLGLGLSEAITFDGFYQTSPASNQQQNVYLSGADGKVINAIAGGSSWFVIGF